MKNIIKSQSLKFCLFVLVMFASIANFIGIGFTQERVPELDINITDGVVDPIPVALPTFVAESYASARIADDISKIINQNLTKTALFRIVPPQAYLSNLTSIDAPVRFADWRAINSDLLIAGHVTVSTDVTTVRFRLWDLVSQKEIFQGVQFEGPTRSIRRIAHKVSDLIYSGVTGEGGYFDSKIAFISERGAKNKRVKRLAIMDQDGANLT